MIDLIAQRIGIGIITALFVSILVFAGTELLPGDVAATVLGRSATPETLAAIREQLGLEQPAYLRYFNWLTGFITGNMGNSLASGVAVSDLIGTRLANTAILAGTTALVSVPLAIMLGLLAATFPGSLLDRTISIFTLSFVSLPNFLLASVLVIIFSVHLRWFPSISYVSEFRDIGHFLQVMTLPVVTLAAATVAQMTRMVRASVLNSMSSPYIEMALLKGVPRSRIVFRHAALNSIGPIANVIALNIAYLISGVIIVETIFSYPGLASLIVDGVSTRDFPVIQSCALIFCLGYITFMLIADVVGIVTNPRLRHAR